MNKSKGCAIVPIPAFECDQLECFNPLLFCVISVMWLKRLWKLDESFEWMTCCMKTRHK